MSVLLRPAIAPAAVPIFSFIVSLALTDAIWALGIPAGVKWPNDVVIGRRKVAGARLDLGIIGDRVSYVVLGVGINVNVLHQQLEAGLGATAAADATSLREALGRPIDRNAFAASVLNHLEKWLGLYRSAGPVMIVGAWRMRDVLAGRRVTVETGGRSSAVRSAWTPTDCSWSRTRQGRGTRSRPVRCVAWGTSDDCARIHHRRRR